VTLELYTWATPNGHKPQIMLAELDVGYELRPVDIFNGAQLTEEFRRINPNRRIPVLVDIVAGQPPHRIFESGAILLHLADKFGRFIPDTERGRSEAIQWLMWQMAGLGPMLGQAQHFSTYATEKHAYAIERYTSEGQRLLGVMDRHLQTHEFLADEYSIADIACFPWVRIHKLANLSIEDLPNLRRWYGTIRNRPAVGRGLNVLREHLSGVPSTAAAHEVMFGKTQFRDT
jgi:GST-like protein